MQAVVASEPPGEPASEASGSETRGFRFTPRQLRRLQRLAAMLDVSQNAAVHEAVAHTLATLERREPLHRLIPSEDPGPKDR